MGVWVHNRPVKTTIEVADHLLLRAKRLARKQGVTLRELTEEGLTKVLADREARRPTARTPVTFKGNGLCPEFRAASWERIRDAVYAGRGT
jgi:hypothetical protein